MLEIRNCRELASDLAALDLQIPREFGSFSPSIYQHFILPMHEDNEALMAAIVRLVEACEPILRKGSCSERIQAVQSILSDVEACR